LKALRAACAQRGVEITTGAAVEDFEIAHERVTGALTAEGTIRAERYCLTTGSWTAFVARRLGIELAIRPIRGQIALLNSGDAWLRRIINEGPRYLVPRGDGRVLVGSTEEEAGFDCRTTAGGVATLLDFALSLCPRLRRANVEATWAGLRPATIDGRPYLGPAPGLANLFVAAGHFRSGLQLSPATAVVLGELIRGVKPQVDLADFRLDR
jgi:glycine oxidase